MMRLRKRLVHWVLDSLPAHQRADVRAFVESTDGRLPLHFLHGYAPDLNPDELVWSHVKRTGTAHRPLQAGEVLREPSDAQLDAARPSPDLVARTKRLEPQSLA